MGVREDCVGYTSYDNRLFPFMHADFLLTRSRKRLSSPDRDGLPGIFLSSRRIRKTSISSHESRSRRGFTDGAGL